MLNYIGTASLAEATMHGDMDGGTWNKMWVRWVARPVCIVHFLMILYCKQSITKSAEFRGHKSDDMKSSVSAHWASANNNLTDVMSLQVFKRLTPMVGIYKVHHAEIIPEQAALKIVKKISQQTAKLCWKLKWLFSGRRWGVVVVVYYVYLSTYFTKATWTRHLKLIPLAG